MTVNDVMSKPPVTCTPDASLSEVAAKMWTNDCGALPVVDAESHVIGMITDRDICIATGTRPLRSSEILVESVIPGHVATIDGRADLSAALDVMKQHRVRRLPVIDERRHVIGVVSINDLITRLGDHRSDANSVTPDAVLGTLRAISAHLLPVAIDSEIIPASPVMEAYASDAHASDIHVSDGHGEEGATSPSPRNARMRPRRNSHAQT